MLTIESTDRNGLQVCNLLIGSLKEHCASPSYLIASKLLEKTNNETVMAFINETLGIVKVNIIFLLTTKAIIFF